MSTCIRSRMHPDPAMLSMQTQQTFHAGDGEQQCLLCRGESRAGALVLTREVEAAASVSSIMIVTAELVCLRVWGCSVHGMPYTYDGISKHIDVVCVLTRRAGCTWQLAARLCTCNHWLEGYESARSDRPPQAVELDCMQPSMLVVAAFSHKTPIVEQSATCDPATEGQPVPSRT
jgi:hypothetical protein